MLHKRDEVIECFRFLITAWRFTPACIKMRCDYYYYLLLSISSFQQSRRAEEMPFQGVTTKKEPLRLE